MPTFICSSKLMLRKFELSVPLGRATMEMFNHFESCVHDQARKAFRLLVSATSPDFTVVLFFLVYIIYTHTHTKAPVVH